MRSVARALEHLEAHVLARNRQFDLIGVIQSHPEMLGIGIDENTAILVTPDGAGTMVGSSAAYFLQAPGPAQVLAVKTPLTYHNIGVYKVPVLYFGWIFASIAAGVMIGAQLNRRLLNSYHSDRILACAALARRSRPRCCSSMR